MALKMPKKFPFLTVLIQSQQKIYLNQGNYLCAFERLCCPFEKHGIIYLLCFVSELLQLETR